MGDALQREMRAYGFDVWAETKSKRTTSAIQSAFLKANTLKQLLIIEAGEEIVRELPKGQQVKIKVEVDTDPPGGFETEIAYLLQPIPFSVRVYTLPDLFAGKMHALLCRKWKQRVKGRDWYDLIWYVTHHPTLHLSHLEQRLRQSGDRDVITPQIFRKDLHDAIDALDVDQAKRDIEPFCQKSRNTGRLVSHFFSHACRSHSTYMRSNMSKTAIITGAGTGIGAGIAIAFAEAGYNLTLVGRRVEPLEEIGRQCGSANIEICAADVADRQAVQLLAEQTVAAFWSHRYFSEQRGYQYQKRHLNDIADEDWDRVMEINLTGAFNAFRAVLPQMKVQNDGLVINISSMAGKRAGMISGVAYCASKFGMPH